MTEERATAPASLPRRLGAALLDWLVYVAAFLTVMLLLPLLEDLRLPGLGPFSAPALGATALAAVAVYQLALLTMTGQSLGKRWLHIEVLRTNGRPPGFLFAVLLRSIVPALIPVVVFLLFSDRAAGMLGATADPLSGGVFITGPLGLLDVLLVFGPGRRCLHDYLAGTRVVVGYAVPVRVRHGRLLALAVLLAPAAVFSSTAASFALIYAKSCSGQHKDCDGRWATLCEADLGSIEHCGACGNECGEVNASASCVEARCVIACGQGFANCDGAASNGCEVELSSDGAHCGGCAVDCKGASCKDGICGPLRLGRGAVIAVDDTAVYADAGDLVKIPLDGAPPVRLAPLGGQHAWPSVYYFGMAVDRSRVYWAPQEQHRILTVPIQGGPVVVAAETTAPTPVIALAGKTLVWIDGVSHDILMTAPTSGGQPAIVVSGRYPTSATRMFAAGESGIAWANSQGLWFLPTSSHLPRKLVEHEIPWGTIVMDSTHVYWVESNALKSVSQMGGRPTQLAAMRTAMPLLLDEDYVYWADMAEGGNRTGVIVMKVSKKGGDPVVLTTHPFYLHGFALNSTHLFWADEQKDVFMFPKNPH